MTVIFIFTLLQVYGQRKWTLEDCIRYAVGNNLTIRQSGFETEIADQHYRQSKWNMMPSVGASSDLYYYVGRTIDQTTNTIVTEPYSYNSYYVGASVDIFNGFSVQNTISYWKFKKESAKNSEINAVDNLAFEVMNSFFDVVYYEELLRITREQKEMSKINVNRTEVLVKTGLKATADLLEVNANMEKDELSCIQAENKLEASWINLRKAMNLSSDSTIVLTRSGLDQGNESDNIDIRNLYESYSQLSPQVKSFENAWKASLKNINIFKAGFYPSLSGGGSFGANFSTNSEGDFSYQFKANQYQYVGLRLSIPVFQKRENISNIKIARLESESAKTKLEQAKRDLFYEMMTNYNDLKASVSEFTQAKKQLEADTLAFRAAEMKYDQGMINVVDFYIAKNRMAATTGMLLRSQLTVEIKKRIIDFYNGNRFWEK